MVCGHNLDITVDRIMGFNLGPDCLEFFDKGILAPRINVKKRKYQVEYALPKGVILLPGECGPLETDVFDKQWLEERFDLEKLGWLDTVRKGDKKQKLVFDNASVTIGGGVSKGVASSMSVIPELTYLVAKLVDSVSIPASRKD